MIVIFNDHYFAMTIIDASVAVKWFVPEDGSGEADQVLESGELLAGPALIEIEVASAIARKAYLEGLGLEEAGFAFRLWRDYIATSKIELVSTSGHLRLAWELSIHLQHPLQDCLYLAVAENLGAPLLTADHKFAAKAKSHKRIQLLG